MVEAVAGTAVGALAVLLSDAHLLAFAAVASWSLLAYPRVPAVGGPLLRQLTPLVQAAGVVLAVTAVLVAAGAVAVSVQAAVVLPVVLAAAAATIARLVRVRRAGPVRVLLVGDLMDTSRWVEQWRGRRDVQVVGAVLVDPDTDPDQLPQDVAGVPVSTSLDQLPAVVELWGADLVAFAPSPGLTQAEARRATWALEGSRAALAVVGLFESVAPHRITAGVIGGETLCEVEPPRAPVAATAAKHAADRVIAALLLVAVAPLVALTAAVIRLDSPGPALFRQTRVGRHGRPFTVYKMRTMRANADQVKHELAEANESDGVLFKMRRDPRVTRVGHFLRRSSMDELPQLVNVLRGEMSLVGPRPFLSSETAEMSSDALRRTAVKPGITGLWQVSGRSDVPWDEAVALDTYYVDNWSLRADAEIALRTVGAVLRAKGAY